MYIGIPNSSIPPYLNECGRTDLRRRTDCLSPGAVAEVLYMILTELRIDYELVPTNETATGVFTNATGDYDGYLGWVQSGVVDTFLSDFTPTNERLEHFAFTQPYMIDDWVVAAPINRNRNRIGYNAFLLFRMFTAQVWVSLFWIFAIMLLARVMAEWSVAGVPTVGVLLNGGMAMNTIGRRTPRLSRSYTDSDLAMTAQKYAAALSGHEDISPIHQPSIRKSLYSTSAHQSVRPNAAPRRRPTARAFLSRSMALKGVVTASAYCMLILQNVYKGTLLSSLLFDGAGQESFSTFDQMVDSIANGEVHLALERPNTALYPAILAGTGKSMSDLRRALARNPIRFEPNMSLILADVESAVGVTIDKEDYVTVKSLDLCNVRTFRVELEGVNPYLAFPLSETAAPRYRHRIDQVILSNMDRISKIVSKYKQTGTSCGEFVNEGHANKRPLEMAQMLGAVLIWCMGMLLAAASFGVQHVCEHRSMRRSQNATVRH